MAELTRGGGGSHPQKRQYRRFTVHYPVNVKFDLGTSVSELRAFSNNISLGGVLLQSDSAIPQHCDVSFVLTVREHQIVGPIQIVGEGEVVRVERTRPEQDLRAGVRASSQPRELQSRW
jgi:c-di-GMP-binding flagellar brake protein YcgR